jgi:ubiquinone/menaquinone biosynthesis C-methylase UbiE
VAGRGATLCVCHAEMPILKINSAVERYRYFARPEFNIHTLAGHGEDGLSNIEFVSTRILNALSPDDTDVIVDVGCGDGYLLAEASRRGAHCIGVVPTPEEHARLKSERPGIRFLLGTAQHLPLDSHCASKIVCNSVLVLLENECNVRSALREISRIARYGASVWLGEIPAANELTEFRVYNGTSIAGLLKHELTYKGLRPFLATLKSITRSAFGSETLLVNSCPIFHASPQKLIAMAEDCGLRIRSWHKHSRLDRGIERESLHRFNYIFTKGA